MSQRPQPIPANERIRVLDALRGFALLGICVANLASFTGWDHLSPEHRDALPTAGLDGLVRVLQRVFIHGKFYTLFSLLFGLGFAIQLARAPEDAGRFAGRFRRRLLILLAFGVIHVCVWGGDILVLYALCGLLLLQFRTRSDRTLLVWATVLLMVPVLQYAMTLLTGGAIQLSAPLYALGEAIDKAMRVPENPFKMLAQGGLVEFARFSAANPVFRFGDYIWEARPAKVFAVFLIGLWAGRRVFAGTLLNDTRLLRRVLMIGMLIGLPTNVVLAVLMERKVVWPPSSLGLLQFVVYALGVVPLALAYASAIALAWRTNVARRILGLCEPAGRMALTCYLSQTAIGIGVFCGFGLGYMGTLGPAGWTLFAIVVFAAQAGLCALWLKFFRFGPMEWLWRRLSYGQFPRPNEPG